MPFVQSVIITLSTFWKIFVRFFQVTSLSHIESLSKQTFTTSGQAFLISCQLVLFQPGLTFCSELPKSFVPKSVEMFKPLKGDNGSVVFSLYGLARWVTGSSSITASNTIVRLKLCGYSRSSLLLSSCVSQCNIFLTRGYLNIVMHSENVLIVNICGF